MIYQFPAMSMEHEFNDLDYVGRYSDSMIEKTRNQDWGVVYEYDDDFDQEADLPPHAVLLRMNGKWVRRSVRATLVKGKWLMNFVDEDEKKST